GVAERVRRWCRREPALVTAGSVAFLCLAALALIAWLSWASVSAAAEREAAARIEAEKLNQRGKELLQGRRFDDVFKFLNLPGGAPPFFAGSKTKQEGQKLQEAPEPPEVQELFNKAKQALSDGKLQAAEEHLFNALALRPKEPRPLITLL